VEAVVLVDTTLNETIEARPHNPSAVYVTLGNKDTYQNEIGDEMERYQ